MIIVFTTNVRITAIISTEITIVAIYRSLLATILEITTISEAFIIFLTVFRNIGIDTTLNLIAVRFSTSIRSITNNVSVVVTTVRRITRVSSTSIIIITVFIHMSDSSFRRFSVRITCINSTFIVIINRSNSVLTSNVMNTFNSVTSILRSTFVIGIGTSRRRITIVYSTRIVVITANGFMVTTSLRIAEVIGTSASIIARFSIGVASNSRIARINLTFTSRVTNDISVDTTALRRNTVIIGTIVIIVTNYIDMLASFNGIARICGTRITVITVNTIGFTSFNIATII